MQIRFRLPSDDEWLRMRLALCPEDDATRHRAHQALGFV
jgi:hypothetical protein